jgi:hypothetical protein
MVTKKKKFWIEDAIKDPGALRAELHVKEGEDIPADVLEAAAKKQGIEGKRARLAETLSKLRKKKQNKK